jgi:hypothetical protein
MNLYLRVPFYSIITHILYDIILKAEVFFHHIILRYPNQTDFFHYILCYIVFKMQGVCDRELISHMALVGTLLCLKQITSINLSEIVFPTIYFR